MSLVLFDVRDNIALLTLNNPDKRNMLTVEVCALITDYVRQAEAHHDVKALIVKETGSVLGEVNAETVEIYGYLDGKISAQKAS